MAPTGTERLLAELNPAQRRAVSTTEGPLLVLAGAGTGKTRVITYRIAHLLARGVAPENILAVTFTNKAAREMRERIGELLGRRPRDLTLSTFHALGARILRSDAEALGLRKDATIHDTSDQVSLVRTILRDIRGAVSSADARGILARVSLAKNAGKSPADVLDEASDDMEWLVARVFHRYEEELRHLNSVDFDDLIGLPVRLLESNEEIRERYRRRFRYILIDEYQDTNGAQYRFTQALVGADRNLCVVGDDDQSIYAFRGADVDKILRFEKDFPGAVVVKLEENYRSSGAILRLANAVIASGAERHPKSLRATVGTGAPVQWIEAPDAQAEVDCILSSIGELRARENLRYEDFAILLRSAIQARPFEEKLRLRRIPYTLVGGQSWFDRKEVRDAVAYWKVASNPRDDLSLLRIINVPRRGLGAGSIEKLDAIARETGKPLLETLGSAADGGGSRAIATKAREAARELAEVFRRARERIAAGRALEACRGILEDVGYPTEVRQLYPDPLTAQARWNAVESLLESLDRWASENPGESIAEFLGSLTLDDRTPGEKESPRGLTLMTLHSAKGLEFPVVFLPGIEEEILPHRRSVADGERAIEEERRLFYVGITRARKRLFITTARSRSLWGKDRERTPSRFLAEAAELAGVARQAMAPPARATEDDVKRLLAGFRARREEGSAP